MISFTRFPLHCCMSVCVALPLCVCVCSRRKMAALIRVDISGHTTAAPLEIATTPPYTHTHLHTHTHGKKGRKGIVWIMRQLQRATFKCQQSATRKVGGSGWERDNGRRFFFFSPTAFSCWLVDGWCFTFFAPSLVLPDSLSHNFHPFPGYSLFSQIVSLEWCHMWRHSETWALTVQRFGSVWLEKHFQVMQNFLATTVPLFANK